MPQSRAITAVMFWLAQANHGGPSSSSTIRRCTSQALARASPPLTRRWAILCSRS